MAENQLLERMTNKVGPLPAWAWAAIPAVGYIGYSYYKAAKGDTTATDTTATDPSLDPTAGYGLNTGGSYLPSYGAIDGSGNLPYVGTPTYNNQTWSRQAINFLISEGISASDSITAINAYINGYPPTLNSTQMAALQKAITKFGPAPETAYLPTLAGGTSPTPTTTKVPEQPTTVVAAPYGTRGIRVTWGPPQQLGGSAVIGYKVELYKRTISTGTGTPLGGTPVHADTTTSWSVAQSQLTLPNARQAIFTGLASKTVYLARVYARNIKGYGPFTASTGVTVP
jgi:hypothetical protein